MDSQSSLRGVLQAGLAAPEPLALDTVQPAAQLPPSAEPMVSLGAAGPQQLPLEDSSAASAEPSLALPAAAGLSVPAMPPASAIPSQQADSRPSPQPKRRSRAIRKAVPAAAAATIDGALEGEQGPASPVAQPAKRRRGKAAAPKAAMELSPEAFAAAAVAAAAAARTAAAEGSVGLGAEAAPLAAAAAADGEQPQQVQPQQVKRKGRGKKTTAGAAGAVNAADTAADAVEGTGAATAAAAKKGGRRAVVPKGSKPAPKKGGKAAMAAAAIVAAGGEGGEAAPGSAGPGENGAIVQPTTPAKKKRARKTPAADNPSEAATEVGECDCEAAAPAPKRKGGGRRKPIDPLPFTDPTPELLAGLAGYDPGPLPVPNLGYACLNMVLRTLNPPIFTSRDCIKKSFDNKGLPFIGELAMSNSRDLARLIQWNHEKGIRLFRMSSVLFPWVGTYEIDDLPNRAELATALRFAGDLARAYDQRLTFHPSHFVKLGAPNEELVAKSIRELEGHSQILDLLGYPPSHWNKINIHIGGVYNDKEGTLQRFADNFAKLSPNCRARLTVENDDIANSYSLKELLELHEKTGIPLVFDFHHHKFCTGGLTEEEAFKAALKTWPAGIRPVVHWSESQPGRKPHAHSDYVRGPIFLHGLEADVDVMIEAKCKEQALLCYRDGLPIPEGLSEVADKLHVEG
ncbi:hypothetical protein N2152v2_010811 [Parachlorella kessleri]